MKKKYIIYFFLSTLNGTKDYVTRAGGALEKLHNHNSLVFQTTDSPAQMTRFIYQPLPLFRPPPNRLATPATWCRARLAVLGFGWHRPVSVWLGTQGGSPKPIALLVFRHKPTVCMYTLFRSVGSISIPLIISSHRGGATIYRHTYPQRWFADSRRTYKLDTVAKSRSWDKLPGCDETPETDVYHSPWVVYCNVSELFLCLTFLDVCYTPL